MTINNIKKGSKEHILLLLNKAKEASLEEQDRYRVIIENSYRPEGNKDIDERYVWGGWEMVLKVSPPR